MKKIEQLQDVLRLSLLEDNQNILTVNTVLCVTSRVLNLSNLDLGKAGIAVNQGAIAVDEYICTNQTNIFAVGDCTNRPHWTPVAIATGHAFADTVFGNQPRTVSLECIPLRSEASTNQSQGADFGANGRLQSTG